MTLLKSVFARFSSLAANRRCIPHCRTHPARVVAWDRHRDLLQSGPHPRRNLGHAARVQRESGDQLLLRSAGAAQADHRKRRGTQTDHQEHQQGDPAWPSGSGRHRVGARGSADRRSSSTPDRPGSRGYRGRSCSPCRSRQRGRRGAAGRNVRPMRRRRPGNLSRRRRTSMCLHPIPPGGRRVGVQPPTGSQQSAAGNSQDRHRDRDRAKSAPSRLELQSELQSVQSAAILAAIHAVRLPPSVAHLGGRCRETDRPVVSTGRATRPYAHTAPTAAAVGA